MSRAETAYSIRSARRRGRFESMVPRELAESWLRDPEALRSQLPDASPNRPARSGPIETELGRVFGKSAPIGGRKPVFPPGLPFFQLRRGAYLAFEIAERLADRDVRAARPIALIEDLDESLGLWEYVDAPDLRAYLIERLAPGLGDGESRLTSLLAALADTVAALHGAGVRQRDLKAPNILIPEAPVGEALPTLVDVEGMSYLSPVSEHRARVRDLARLWVSLRARELAALGIGADDWARLLSRYRETAGQKRVPLEAWVSATTRWAERKEARNARKGEPAW